MIIDGTARLALTEFRDGAIHIETASTRLQLVKNLVDNTKIGTGFCYGDEKHIAALDEIGAHIEAVRHKILAHNASDETNKT